MNTVRVAPRFATAFVALVTIGGCASILGIDHDYGTADDAGGSSAATGTGAGGFSPGSGGSGGDRGSGGDAAPGAMGGGAGSAGQGGSGGSPGTGGSTGGDGGANGGSAGADIVDSGLTGGGPVDGSIGAGGAAGSGGSDAGGLRDAIVPIPSPILRVQRGTASIAAGAMSQGVAIQQLDLTRSFLVFGSRFDGVPPLETEVSGQISGSTALTFARAGAAGAPALPVQYYVAEFQSGVLVQRGASTMSSTQVSVTLPTAVDPTKSFPIVTYRNTGAGYGMDDFVRAKLTSPTQLSLESALAAPNGIVEWQLISFDGASVQSGDVAVAAGDTLVTAPLQNVDPARTWLVFSYVLATFTSGASETMIRGRVETATQLAFRRTVSGATGTLTWYAVSFNNGTTVQSATSSFGGAAATATAPLGAVDPMKTIAATGGLYMRGGATAFVTNVNLGYATFTLDVGAGSQLSLTRGVTAANGAASADWFAITFF